MLKKFLLASVFAIAATLVFSAEPSLQTALLPDAEIIIAFDKSFDDTAFVQSLNKQLFEHIKTLCADNQGMLARIQELQQENNGNCSGIFAIKLSSALKDAKKSKDFDAGKLEYALAMVSDAPMTQLIEKKLNEEGTRPNSETTVQKTAFKDGWTAYELVPKKEPEFKSVAAVSPDGKRFLLGPRKVLLRQLDKPAPLTAPVQEYFTQTRLTGPVCSFATIITDELVSLLDSDPNIPEEAQQFKNFKSIELAVKGGENSLEIRMDANYRDAAKAQELKTILDEQLLPMLPILGPSLLQGKNIPMLTAAKSYLNDSHVGIAFPVVQEDINTLIELVKAKAAQIKQAREAAKQQAALKQQPAAPAAI